MSIDTYDTLAMVRPGASARYNLDWIEQLAREVAEGGGATVTRKPTPAGTHRASEPKFAVTEPCMLLPLGRCTAVEAEFAVSDMDSTLAWLRSSVAFEKFAVIARSVRFTPARFASRLPKSAVVDRAMGTERGSVIVQSPRLAPDSTKGTPSSLPRTARLVGSEVIRGPSTERLVPVTDHPFPVQSSGHQAWRLGLIPRQRREASHLLQ